MVTEELDRSETSFIDREINDAIEEKKTGKVLSVYEHLESDDNSNFEADVRTNGGTQFERVVPLTHNSPQSIDVPRVGDTVLIGFREGDEPNPVILGYNYTTTDRPPVGKSGIHREEYESANSPVGDGNIYVTGYTKYDGDPANENVDSLSAEESFVQIAKRTDSEPDPSAESSLPAKIEFYDAPASDEGHITVELNKVNSSDTDPSWGFKVNFKTGAVKMVDPQGTGIVSNGFGDWTWEYKSKTENQVIGDGSLSL